MLDTFGRVIEGVFTESGTFAVLAIVMVIGLLLLIYTLYLLVRQKNNDGKTTATQAQVIAALVEPTAKIAAQLQAVSETNRTASEIQSRVIVMLDDHAKRVDALSSTLDTAVKSMQQVVHSRDEELAALPDKVRREMAPDFNQLPKAIEDALTPKIEDIKSVLQNMIADLDTKIAARIAEASEQIPAETTQLVCSDLLALKQTVEKGLDDMRAIIEQLTQNAPDNEG